MAEQRMGFRIAITGKGGVGKTSVAALSILRLIARGRRPILAIDADPNTCLDAALGIRADYTIGGVREHARQIVQTVSTEGMSKQTLLEMKIAESLVEGDDFDLIAMGRPEGPGCYCYANNVVKATLALMAEQYPYIVLDNEAGLENLSRRLVQQVDLLIIVSDASRSGLETVRRLHQLAREMGIVYERLAIVVNRNRRERLPAGTDALQAATHAQVLIGLPDDAEFADFAEQGKSLSELPQDNLLVRGIDDFLDRIGI
ncbi:MAG: AAA family ATPase [Acidiferrobacterales bacterium]